MRSKVKSLIQTYTVELGVTAYLLYLMIIAVPSEIYGWVTVWYAMDYRYGFGSRMMLGSILHIFTGEYLGTDEAYHFVVGSLVVLCVLLALFCGMIYRKAESAEEKNVRGGVLFLIALYLASPASPAYLWTAENMGRLETYLFISTLLLVFIYVRIKNTSLKYILFILIGSFATSVHQIYFFLFFPSLLVMMIQDIWETGFRKRQIIYSVGTACIVGAVFLYMQFKSGVYFDSAKDVYDAVSGTTDLYIDEAAIDMEYFWTIKDHFVQNQLPELPQRIRFGLITVALLSPMWGIHLIIWIRAMICNKEQKYKYILMLLTNVAYVPVFALLTDWGRWFAALFIVQFLNTMVLYYAGDSGIKEGISFMFGEKSRWCWAIYLLILIYLSGFEKFEGINMLQQVQDFFYGVYDLKVALFGP